MFSDCTSLTSIEIPSSVTGIESSAFQNCRELNSVIFHEGIRSIGYSAFYGCTSLTSIEIPASVETIYDLAFARCESFEYIKSFNYSPSECYYTSFDGIDPAIPVYVPKESIEQYRNAEGWNYFTNFLPLEEDPVAVEETQAAAINIYADHGTIYCEGVAEFEIYNLVGQEVSNKNGSLKGMYIVVAGEEVLKLMVD